MNGASLWSIPACAGEPRRSARLTGSSPVYPRVCGGTRIRQRLQSTLRGLSPRVRGNQRVARAGPGRGGSIPACAGEPIRLAPGGAVVGVYPRVCGGTKRRTPRHGRIRGLSPRVRGNHRAPTRVDIMYRSIPACAGEPVSGAVPPVTTRVYPRVCGGTAAADSSAVLEYGLSPRVRGNPCIQAGDKQA